MLEPAVKRLKSLEEENARQGSGAKALTTGQKREAVVLKCDATGLPQRRACRLTGLFQSTCRYDAQRPTADAHLSGRILNADVLVIGASGSCCALKAFMLITSACTTFIISVGWA